MDSGGTALVISDVPVDHFNEETKLEQPINDQGQNDLEQRDQNVFVFETNSRAKTQIILDKGDAKANQNQGNKLL